ncbi:hypothetical protein [Sphingomonas mesophila]|uniref:hypothetical protein n=1 Tax=Sphingomonas mesophila TaxID=2303576 RepID=UPI000E59291C|nr:hypothetical protein [Sphingomonas mesophila]
MRALFALPLVMLAVPAAAQPRAPQSTAQAMQIPPELTSPETAKKLGKMAAPLARALMSLPVGEIEAIAEGREPTAADKRRTVRDMAAADGRDIERELANAGPMIEQSAQRLTALLPVLMRSLAGLGAELEKATANLPQPGYPKR